MPKESVNLYLSIQSGSSEHTLTSLSDKTKALDKDTQLLQQATAGLASANKPLLEQQTKLQAELKASQKSVNELQKAYDEYGDEASKLRLDKAIEEHSRLKQELTEVNAQIGANQKTYKEYLETVRKGGLQGGDADAFGSSLGDVLGGLGIGSMMSDLLGNIANQQISSALGSSMGSAVSGALSSAVSGAALGTAIAPGLGTALGAALGGITGALNGAADMYAEQDDAFIAYYNGLLDTYGGLSAGNTAAGSTIAAGRETDLISFATMFGSRDAAEEYLRNLVDMSNRTPFLYDDLTGMSKTLATYGYDENSILPVLQTIGDAGAALGQSTSDMTSVATAIGRMVSSDKATLEYLNILNDRGINAVGYLAEARGKSVADTYADISGGKISGTEAADIILAAMEESYAGSMEAQSKTFAGLTSTLEGMQQEISNAAGEGYNTLRKESIQTEIDSLGGALGDAMREINTIIGENQARGENLKEEYIREAIAAVLLGGNSGLFTDKDQATLDEWAAKYDDAAERYAAGEEKAGLEMQALYENAQMLGQAAYESSEWAQEEIDVQLEQIAAIRENTYGLAATTSALRSAIERSKGGSSVNNGYEPIPQEEWAQAMVDSGVAWDYIPTLASTPGWYDDGGSFHPYAYGLDRVPYDDYPALLHEGERVLTASEARAMDQGGGRVINLTISGVTINGTVEEAADQLAEILAQKLEQAAIVYGG